MSNRQNRSLAKLIMAYRDPDSQESMKRGNMPRATKGVWIAVVLVVAVSLGIWTGLFGGSGDQVELLKKLPDGQWFDFHGGCGGGGLEFPNGTIPDTHDPEDYDIPEGLEHFNPENVRRALKGLKAQPISSTERLRNILSLTSASIENQDLLLPENTGVDRFFSFWFRDSEGNTWAMWILNDGEIILDSWAPNTSTLFFRDDGTCYRVFRERFGDSDDMASWRKPDA